MPARKKAVRRRSPNPTRKRLTRTWNDVLRQAARWRTRIDREGRRARSRVESGIGELRERARKDRRALQKTVDGAVSRALVALNIPSRRELLKLQRQVDALQTRMARRRR